MEKVQWNSIEKNKMDLNIRKMTNHPPSHGTHVVMYSDTRTDVHSTHQKKFIYMIIVTLIVVMRRINDFTKINLVHVTPTGITYYNTKWTYKCFIDWLTQRRSCVDWWMSLAEYAKEKSWEQMWVRVKLWGAPGMEMGVECMGF